jgi:exopolysaccharide biosynthesis WecB/TagA/CpsF family protein
MTAEPETKERRSPESGTKTDRRVATYKATKLALEHLEIEDRRVSRDRRQSVFDRWRKVLLGGLPVAVVDREESAKALVDHALKRRGLWRYPAYITSTNGEVTYRCAVDKAEHSLFLEADAIHADGMPHVFVSRTRCAVPLPERVATTDLFHDVAAKAEAAGATMYMLGATDESNRAAVKSVKEKFPNLLIVGNRHGFFESRDQEIEVCEQIAALEPDILWISMGVPREQEFISRNRRQLASIGVIKTSGGLFDFLSGSRKRAPLWLQNAGLEWLWRTFLEPRRLGWRYLKTNPLAMYLLLTRSR